MMEIRLGFKLQISRGEEKKPAKPYFKWLSGCWGFRWRSLKSAGTAGKPQFGVGSLGGTGYLHILLLIEFCKGGAVRRNRWHSAHLQSEKGGGGLQDSVNSRSKTAPAVVDRGRLSEMGEGESGSVIRTGGLNRPLG